MLAEWPAVDFLRRQLTEEAEPLPFKKLIWETAAAAGVLVSRRSVWGCARRGGFLLRSRRAHSRSTGAGCSRLTRPQPAAVDPAVEEKMRAKAAIKIPSLALAECMPQPPSLLAKRKNEGPVARKALQGTIMKLKPVKQAHARPEPGQAQHPTRTSSAKAGRQRAAGGPGAARRARPRKRRKGRGVQPTGAACPDA